MSALPTMLDQEFGCFANQQDANTQKGQVPSSCWSSATGSLAESRGWNAENKNNREKTSISFLFLSRRGGHSDSFRKPFLLPPLELPRRAAPGAALAKLELSPCAWQLGLAHSQGLPLQTAPDGPTPALAAHTARIKPCPAHWGTRRGCNL